MKIVIDIPDELKNQINYDNYEDMIRWYSTALYCVIENGTQLPKGHGRLIDAEAFTQSMCTYQQTGCGSCNHQLCCPEDAPTIIETDQVESGDKE